MKKRGKILRKRGLSTVVTTLILILLVFVAIGIVWVVIKNVLSEGVEGVFLEKFTVSLKIKNVEIDDSENNISMRIKRNPGAGDLFGIKFIFNDGDEVFERERTIEELGEEGFSFISINSSNVKIISIAPVYKSKSGKKIIGNIVDVYKIRRSSQTCFQLGGLCCPSGDTCSSPPFQSASDCFNRCCIGGTCVPCISDNSCKDTTCIGETCTDSCENIYDGELSSNCGILDECGPAPNECGGPNECGTCDSGYYCPSGTCEIITNPCTFDTIVWSPPGSVVEGAIASFTITSTGDCDGESVDIDVWEDDTWPLSDTLVTTSPISVSFSGNTATGTWTTSWMDDGGGDDPEYFLKASLVNNPSETVEGSQAKAEELTVTQAGQPCTFGTIVWSPPGSVVEGATAGFTITSTGDCDGESVDIDVWEDDTWPLSDTLVTTSPISVSFSGNTATGTWTTSWMDDGGGDDPEYFLKASLVNNPSETVEGSQAKAEELTVTQALGDCDTEGGEICGVNYYCDVGDIIPSSDPEDCCTLDRCRLSECTICDTCGDGWLNICDRAECEACTSDTCYFTNDCYSCTSATCEAYSDDQQTCSDDPCGLGSCSWDGSACTTHVQTETEVYRTISNTMVSPGETIEVTIDISIIDGGIGKAFYVIDENFTSAFNFVSAYGTMGGTVSVPITLNQSGNLFVLYFEEAEFPLNVRFDPFIYTIEAPSTPGSYEIKGIYLYENLTGPLEEREIIGPTIVTVGL